MLAVAIYFDTDDHVARQEVNAKAFLAGVDLYLDGLPDIKHFAPLG